MEPKKQLYILLLLTLMALKVSSLPIYFDDCHEEEHIDDCALCDYAIYNQNTEFSIPPEFENFKIDTYYFLDEPKIHFESRYYKSYRNDRYFGRPPPIF